MWLNVDESSIHRFEYQRVHEPMPLGFLVKHYGSARRCFAILDGYWTVEVIAVVLVCLTLGYDILVS
jgi:hypothetical protein